MLNHILNSKLKNIMKKIIICFMILCGTYTAQSQDLIKELKIAGAVVSWHDPFVKVYEGQQSVALTSEIDLGLIVTPHSQIDFSIWKKKTFSGFFNLGVQSCSDESFLDL